MLAYPRSNEGLRLISSNRRRKHTLLAEGHGSLWWPLEPLVRRTPSTIPTIPTITHISRQIALENGIRCACTNSHMIPKIRCSHWPRAFCCTARGEFRDRQITVSTAGTNFNCLASVAQHFPAPYLFYIISLYLFFQTQSSPPSLNRVFLFFTASPPLKPPGTVGLLKPHFYPLPHGAYEHSPTLRTAAHLITSCDPQDADSTRL